MAICCHLGMSVWQYCVTLVCLFDTIAKMYKYYAGEKNKHLFEKDWGSEVTIPSKFSDSRLVAILFKENLNFKVIEIEKDVEHNNLLLIHLHVCEFNFYLLVIYGPNTDSPDFF